MNIPIGIVLLVVTVNQGSKGKPVLANNYD